jgi:predicted ferric reductase
VESRYWPEWMGVGLLAVVVVQFVFSQWRQSLALGFHRWLPVHRIAGLVAAILLVVHVLFVSESFTADGPPRLAVVVAAVCFGLIWLWVRFQRLRTRKTPYAVSRVEPAGLDSTCVELTPTRTAPMAYVPGQFVFVSFQSARVTAEPHAFTLSSAPSRPDRLQFTIRACGDWTRSLNDLAVGDRAYIQGPFGRFGHLFADSNRPLIMIAGGIGITPMLSMLRFMADSNDTRPIVLIWSNRSRAHTVFDNEMTALEAQLTGFRRIPIFTRNTQGRNHAGRLNRQSLKAMVEDCSRRSVVFVCGPPPMMKRVRSDLRALGFPSRSIFHEAFGF